MVGVAPLSRGGNAVSGVSRGRTLPTYDINGVALLAYDEEGSLAADPVAGELWQDIYGLDAIPFQPGDCVIDIGAHIGLVSMYLARRWPFLRIHAFEPHPINHRELRAEPSAQQHLECPMVPVGPVSFVDVNGVRPCLFPFWQK